MKNKDPPEGFASVLRNGSGVFCLTEINLLPKQTRQMTTKQVLKCLDGVQRVFVKLEKIALKAYLLATLIYALYKIIAQH